MHKFVKLMTTFISNALIFEKNISIFIVVPSVIVKSPKNGVGSRLWKHPSKTIFKAHFKNHYFQQKAPFPLSGSHTIIDCK